MPIIGNYHLPLKWHFQSPYEGLFNQLKSKKARGKETASLEMAGRNLVTIPAPEFHSLKSGLTVVSQQIPGTYSGMLIFFVRAGSVFENESNNGVSHFLEHMVFKRTKHRSGKQIVEQAGNVGSSLNAATSNEITYFYGKQLGEKISTPTELISEMLFDSKMIQKDFDIERGVIVEEINESLDDPSDRVSDLASRVYFKGHPLSRPILGTRQTVGNMERSVLKSFLGDTYLPNNMVVSVAGNIKTDEIIRHLEDLTSGIEKKSKRTEIPKLTYNPGVAVEGASIKQAHIIISSIGYPLESKKRYSLGVLSQIFGNGMDSRLFQEVREKRGLVYSVSSFPVFESFGGYFIVYASTAPEKTQEAIDIVVKEMQKVKKHGVKESELERAKTQIISSMLLGEESNFARAFSNGSQYLLAGQVRALQEKKESINKVTNKDIIDVAGEIFNPDYFSLAVVGPKRKMPSNIGLN